MKNGICVAGNSIVDTLYPIERYPGPGELAAIKDVSRATGGALNNVAMDLAQLDPSLPLQVVGIIGKDEDGDFIEKQLGRFPNISLDGLIRCGDVRTSFTLVMSDAGTKQRTFFTYGGGGSVLCEDDFDWAAIKAELFHIGYILLLDTLDEPDATYGTRMARLLKQARDHGKKTSVDIVSEASDRFKKLVPPALRYVDYCVINELEAQQATGICLRDSGGALARENMVAALSALFGMGVSTWAVIHAPEGAFAMDGAGTYIEKPGARLPKGYIKGTVGAGDAFCAGILYAAYSEKPLDEALTMGHASAVCSLAGEDTTSGMREMAQAVALYEEYGVK
ncbi:MAG TPA: carbohydrate kinase family protein [Clostridiales bacterium]|nr:carbohydrate kinase family protein [Clostridiales bacterium]